METVTIEVDCTSPNQKTPQLGITVEAPLSHQRALQQQRKQQAANASAAKDYSNHGYQNLSNLLDNNSQQNHNSNITSQNEHDQKSGTNVGPTNVPFAQREFNPPHLINIGLERPVKHGLQITQIQEGSVIDRNGKFRIGDIIIEVNHISLQLPFVEAQKTLKDFVVNNSSHGPLRLKVLRRCASSSSLPSTNGSQTTVIERNGSVSDRSEFSPTCKTQPANSKQTNPQDNLPNHSNHISHTSRHLGGPLNTRKIGTKHRIALAKGVDGFGIKIAERDNMFGSNRPIYITAITTSGSAYRDGRLKEGDMLLEINGIDLSSRTQPEVTKMLKLVRVDEEVEFVISRQENLPYDDYNNGVTLSYEQKNNCDNDKSLINLDDDTYPDCQTLNNQFEKKVDSILDVPALDGPGTYVYDIPLNDTKSAGLGLYLKYPNLNGKDLGIWIEKVITGGAAWKDGRLQPNDQILSINGIDLVGLSNAQASETLTAAVCRGIGPQATSSTIRLNIRRRDPVVVAKILQGTNNRIEHSDQRDKLHDPTYSVTNMNRIPIQSDQDIRHNKNKPTTDNNLSGSSTGNSNSQSDSGLSPQTQASNSLKLSNSYNDKLEHSNSDKTNDNSSAISQITDFTTVQTADNEFQDHGLTVEPVATQPKTLHTEMNNVNSEATPSIQSWDDESIDNMTGEERFQRDGFGRQSISEKRHAQLLANTDTFRKNQRLREEREKQRELEEKLERQQISDDYMQNQTHQTLNWNHFNHNTNIMASTRSIPGGWATNNLNSTYSLYREAPVDIARKPEVEVEFLPPRVRVETMPGPRYGYTSEIIERPSHPFLPQDYQAVPHPVNQVQTCWYCNQCICAGAPANRVSYDTPNLNMMKCPNSPTSMQHQTAPEHMLLHRPADTIGVSRGRKINESFRRAVDRSYENSFNTSSSQFGCQSNERRSTTSLRGANSTTSTANDERQLLANRNSSTNVNPKKSSLLTRFLKFGSMKRIRRKHINKDAKNTSPKEISSSSRSYQISLV